jgi:hypothetical protein
MFDSAVFLPLTLAAIADVPTGRRGRSALADAAASAEQAAWDTWQALLGVCTAPADARFPARLRGLSEAAAVCAGVTWWNGPASGHRDRVDSYHRWLGEALAEGDGAEFASAVAGFDNALAAGLASTVARDARSCPPTRPRRPGIAGVRPSGTMAVWARQARAVTYRATHRAVSPLRWATSRPATSSSRWSRRSRSAG